MKVVQQEGHEIVPCEDFGAAPRAAIHTLEYLRAAHDRVAILDIDVHHGDPRNSTPFFTGHAHERGEAEGLGYNINKPLALGTDIDGYLPALRYACDSIRAYAPGALVVALGLDAHEHDPYKVMKIRTPGFAVLLAEIARLGLPTVLVQEGGYLSDDLGPNIASALRGCAQAA